jgi:hypothetical protein
MKSIVTNSTIINGSYFQNALPPRHMVHQASQSN